MLSRCILILSTYRAKWIKRTLIYHTTSLLFIILQVFVLPASCYNINRWVRKRGLWIPSQNNSNAELNGHHNRLQFFLKPVWTSFLRVIDVHCHFNFNKMGWRNIEAAFEKITGEEYPRMKYKHKWDTLKKKNDLVDVGYPLMDWYFTPYEGKIYHI